MEIFLTNLKKRLNGKIVSKDVDDIVNNYRYYINDEINKGRTIDDILKEFGEVDLLIKSIIIANKAKYNDKKKRNDSCYTSSSEYNDYKNNNDSIINIIKNKILKIVLKFNKLIKTIIFILVLILVLRSSFLLIMFIIIILLLRILR